MDCTRLHIVERSFDLAPESWCELDHDLSLCDEDCPDYKSLEEVVDDFFDRKTHEVTEGE